MTPEEIKKHLDKMKEAIMKIAYVAEGLAPSNHLSDEVDQLLRDEDWKNRHEDE